MAKATQRSETTTETPTENASYAIVTYVPGPSDPPVVKWRGHTFHANQAKEVKHAELIEQAKANPFFRVDDGSDQGRSEADNDPRARMEKMFGSSVFIDVATLQQLIAQVKPEIEPSELSGRYRRHAVEWLKSVETTSDLIARWAKDAPLRELCGVGEDDYAYLGTLFRPKLSELRRSEEIDDRKFMAICVQYGVNQLPW